MPSEVINCQHFVIIIHVYLVYGNPRIVTSWPKDNYLNHFLPRASSDYNVVQPMILVRGITTFLKLELELNPCIYRQKSIHSKINKDSSTLHNYSIIIKQKQLIILMRLSNSNGKRSWLTHTQKGIFF